MLHELQLFFSFEILVVSGGETYSELGEGLFKFSRHICNEKNVTKSAKTVLICTKYTYSFYHIYLFFCVGYTISVSFIEFLRKFCVYDEIFDNALC